MQAPESSFETDTGDGKAPPNPSQRQVKFGCGDGMKPNSRQWVECSDCTTIELEVKGKDSLDVKLSDADGNQFLLDLSLNDLNALIVALENAKGQIINYVPQEPEA